MKHLQVDRRKWLRNQCVAQARNSLWSANVRRFRKDKTGAYAKRGRTKTSLLLVPAHLLAERFKERSKILSLLTSALDILSTSNNKVRFDFSRVQRCYPGGMLMLLAYLEMLSQTYPRRVFARCPPRSMSGQLLNHFGLGSNLGVSSSSNAPTHESVVNWHYVTGTKIDGKKVSALLHKYKEIAGAEMPEGLYDVLSEALTNVHHHAYSDETKLPEQMRRWWMFSRYVEPKESEPGNLYIAVYDVGHGIQNTMGRKLKAGELVIEGLKDLYEKAGGSWKVMDRLLLERAVVLNRSSTGLKNRGKGLPEMRDFIQSTESGSLQIISGFSQYASNSKSNSQVMSWSEKVLGTLILWDIPLGQKGVQA